MLKTSFEAILVN